MHYVSLIIESLRGRPTAVFWTAALTQAVLWVIVPSLFYSAPPGAVPTLLAIGHEFQLGSYLGPPLAFWFGEIAFKTLGAFGVYLLAQVCIVVAYWSVFALGRAIVGTKHAVLAVLLMVGVAAFAVPSAEFGPMVLAAPLWGLALLYYWRAVGEGKRGYWFLLAFDLGLLLLTSYIGLLLLALMVLFTPLSRRGRSALWAPEPWVSILLLVIVMFPHAAWLYGARDLVWVTIDESGYGRSGLSLALRLGAVLVFTHVGLLLLAWLASGRPRQRRESAPEILRNPVDPFGRLFVYVFAIVPMVAALAGVLASARLGPLERVAPLVLLSGLALIVAAGDQVYLYRERAVSFAWLGLLLAPPALAVLAIGLLPWIYPLDFSMTQPANSEGRFMAENFQRRTGKPLAFVTGDARLAPLLALGASSRPRVYFDWAPERSPWATAADMRAAGGIMVWPLTDAAGTPPAELKAQFSEMVPEVPRVFARAVQGFLPLNRIGWAVLRPANP